MKDIDAIMQTIPAKWRDNWCGGERGPCACMGCVQVGNRLVMVGRTASQCDPEYIDESKISAEVYEKLKITKAEWRAWIARQNGRE